jgi:hypothetical protein
MTPASFAKFITFLGLVFLISAYFKVNVYVPEKTGQSLDNNIQRLNVTMTLEHFNSNQTHVIIPVPVPIGDFYDIDDNVVVLLARSGINDHTVIRDGYGRWHLIALSGKEWVLPYAIPSLIDIFSGSFEHAISQETSLLAPMSAQPMIVPRQMGERWLWAPHAVEHNGTIYVFYADSSSFLNQGSNIKVLKGYFDGYGGFNEIAGSRRLLWSGTVDRDPMVLYLEDAGLFVLYYCTSGAIAYRFSDDLESWSEPGYALTGAGKDPESPFVVEHDSVYYLFVTDTGDGDRTGDGWNEVLVYASANPFNFGDAYSDYIATIHGHATEVVNDNGSYYITSVNPTPGPDAAVRITPLEWVYTAVPRDNVLK